MILYFMGMFQIWLVVGLAMVIVVRLSWFWLKDAKRIRGSKSGKRKSAGYSAATFTLGIALVHLEMLVNHSVNHEVQEIYDGDADADEQGVKVDPALHLSRQLKQIRHGETVERLVLRLK